MYEPNSVCEKNTLVGMGQIDRNPTIGENIDFKIARLQEEISRLEAAKITMAPMLKMCIRDIRNAMDY